MGSVAVRSFGPPVVQVRALAAFEKSIIPVAKSVVLLQQAPWIKTMGSLTSPLKIQSWKFPAPWEPSPGSSKPESEQTTPELESPPLEAGNPPVEEPPTDFASLGLAKTVTRIKPPAGMSQLKDRLLCLLQPPLEGILGQDLSLPFPPYPYQLQGIAFLMPRDHALIADEMGLGKTLQTLAFFHSCHTNRKLSGPVLIVCPTSLVFNWVAEAKKFTPQLKVVALHGTGRHSRFEDIAKSDLVITSYVLIRRDAEKYREFEFDTLVLDEAQHIKNRQTQNSQAVKAVKANYRVVLTGTPMENSVLDLWSIFDFLMPGYLG